MIRLTNKRLLAFLCFALSIVVMASCRRNNDVVNDGRVELLSFGPTGAKHGDTIRFFGRNLTAVTEIQFTGTNAVVKQSDFKEQTSEVIMAVVPQAAEKGFVTLKTPQGDLVTKTQFNLNVASRVTAISGPVRPGENVTLTGNYMNWVKSVTFNKGLTVSNFVSKSLNQLVVRVPETAQTGRLTISYGGTDSMNVETDTMWVKLPTATAMTPNPIKHAQDVTITGTDLDLTTKVYFNGVATAITSFVSQSATQLVVKVPGGATKGRIRLEAASGVQTTSSADLDIMMPAVSNMTPNPVDIGADLTITGTNLDLVSSVAFTGVNNAVTTFSTQTPTQLVVRVPAGTLKGKVTLNVKNSTLFVRSAADLDIVGASVAPIIVYDNALSANWEKWGGWGTSAQELESTEQPQSGTKAIKVSFNDAYGALQLHPRTTFAFPPPGYTKLKLSVYGGAGTAAGTRIALYMKDATNPTEAQKKVLTLVPGTYTTYEINLSDFSNNPAKVNEFVIQNYGTNNITIYIDDIWFQ